MISITSFKKRAFSRVAASILHKQLGNQEFTIFSNDCYGAEIYRYLKRPYNTPFVGLMLMAPCYLTLLKNPGYYLHQPLNFMHQSKYDSLNHYRLTHGNYPLAQIDDIEIHFLHYKTAQQAEQKWRARILRINWNAIKVKFAMDKDFATQALLQEFVALPYPAKLIVGKETHQSDYYVQVAPYYIDAVATFNASLRSVNFAGWMQGQTNLQLKGLKQFPGIIASLVSP